MKEKIHPQYFQKPSSLFLRNLLPSVRLKRKSASSCAVNAIHTTPANRELSTLPAEWNASDGVMKNREEKLTATERNQGAEIKSRSFSL